MIELEVKRAHKNLHYLNKCFAMEQNLLFIKWKKSHNRVKRQELVQSLKCFYLRGW